MWRALIRLLAHMHGKKPPDVIRLVEESEIHFQVRDGRLRHYGQRIGVPEIDPELVVSSRGSIGIDGTLNLFLEMPHLRKEKLDKSPLKCHVTGKIHEPKIVFKDAPLFVRWGTSGRALKAYVWAFRAYRLTCSLRGAAQRALDRSLDFVCSAPSILVNKKDLQTRKAAASDAPSRFFWLPLGRSRLDRL